MQTKFSFSSILLTLSLLCAAPASALPGILGAQGTLQSQGGGPVADGDYNFTFSLYPQSTGGVALWSEGPVAITVKGSLFSWPLGSTLAIDPAQLANLKSLWLGVKIENDNEMPRKQVLSVAYALRAAVAEGVDCSGCIPAAALAANVLGGLAKTVDLAKIATSGLFADLVDKPNLSAYALLGKLANVASTGNYADLNGIPDLAAYALSAKLAKVATSGSYSDLADKPAQAAINSQCGSGLYVSGIKDDGKLICGAPVGGIANDVVKQVNANFNIDGTGTLGGKITASGADFQAQPIVNLRAHNSAGAPYKCDAAHAGSIYFDTGTHQFFGCDGVSPNWQILTFKSGFNPLSVGGIFAWYDAADPAGMVLNGPAVSQWLDKSGHAYHAFQANGPQQPTLLAGALNNLPVLSFAPGSQVLRFPTTVALNNVTVFTVYQLPTALNYGGASYYPVAFGGTVNQPGLYHGIEIGNASAGNADNLDIFGGFGDDSRANLAGIAQSGGAANYQIIDWTSTSALKSTVFVNGTGAAMSTTGGDVAWNFTLGSGNGGDFGGIGGVPWSNAYVACRWAELIVYNKVLTVGERQQVEGYLAWKWGLQGGLAANHPYKAAPP